MRSEAGGASISEPQPTAGTRVEVLLATRDSARYLGELLDSLVAQEHRDFFLIVGDDCSSDDTLAIIDSYRSRFDNPVTVINRSTPSGSARANFADLLHRSHGDYVLLADHDDVWLPGKIGAAVDRLRAVEATVGVQTPVLTHSDLRVIDGTGREIAPSYWAFKSIDPHLGLRLRTSLVHATVTGCATAVNRALVTRFGALPESSVQHDWWLALTAATFGVVDFDPEPHILYRIHGQNSSNPRRVSPVASMLQLDRVRRMRTILGMRFAQAESFLRAYERDLPDSARLVLEDFTAIPHLNAISRRVRWVRGRYFWPGTWRNVAAVMAL